jgi:DNA-binding response OmpR family regulator
MITEIQREMPQRQPTGILLIEDDGQERYAVLDCLGEAQADSKDFAVRVAGRLDTGLECLAHGGVDAVLLDLFLPDSSGLETFLRDSCRG